MGVVEWICVAVVAGAAYVGRQLLRYPGGWRFAFSRAHADDREDLAGARRAVRVIEDTARKETADAEARITRADQTHRNRVGAARREHQRLRRPGRGTFISDLGEVSLYEHTLLFKGREIPLEGLAVRFELARSSKTTYIYFTRRDGRVDLADYAEAEFPEETVRRFSVRIENAVAAENTFREHLADAIQTAEAELADAQADTAEKESARQALKDLEARHHERTDLAEARTELEAARDRWQALTGQRPR